MLGAFVFILRASCAGREGGGFGGRRDIHIASRAGESGREWCYVEAQLLGGGQFISAAWSFCSPAVAYDGVRGGSGKFFEDKVARVRYWVAKLQQAQRAAEKAFDALEHSCK